MKKMPKTSEKQDKKMAEKLAEAVNLMRVLGHPLRLSILCSLIHRGEMAAGEIVESEAGNFSQSQVSQYLGILRDMGYVKTRREGQVIHYSISDRNVRKVVETLYGIYCGGASK